MGFRKTVLPEDGRTVYEMDSPLEKDGKCLVWRIYGIDGDAWTIGASDKELIAGMDVVTFTSRPAAMKYVADRNNDMTEADLQDRVRRGRFDISAQFLMTIPHNMIFCSNVKIEAFKPRQRSVIHPAGNGKQPGQDMMFDCVGISDYFDEVDDNAEPPRYKIIFTPDENGYMYMIAERED